MTPKAVYWDMDGTLVDSEPLHDEALVRGAERARHRAAARPARAGARRAA